MFKRMINNNVSKFKMCFYKLNCTIRLHYFVKHEINQ